MKQQLFDGQEAGARICEPERCGRAGRRELILWKIKCNKSRKCSNTCPVCSLSSSQLDKSLDWDPGRKRTRRAHLLTGRRSTRASKAQGINLTFIWIDFFFLLTSSRVTRWSRVRMTDGGLMVSGLARRLRHTSRPRSAEAEWQLALSQPPSGCYGNNAPLNPPTTSKPTTANAGLSQSYQALPIS